MEAPVTPSTRHTLSAVLGKAKIGGLVLATLVLVAGTAEAATGASFAGGSEDPVATVDDGFEPVDDVGEVGDPVDDGFEPVTDPVADEVTDPSDGVVDDPGEDGLPVNDGCEPIDGGSEVGAPVDDGFEPVPGEENCPPVDDEACLSAANHGQYVSGIAKSTPPGPGHGAAVSEAAHSDCGKTADEADDEGTDSLSKHSPVKAVKEHPGVGHFVAGSDLAKKTPPGQAKKDQPTTSHGNSGNAHANGHGSTQHGQGPKK